MKQTSALLLAEIIGYVPYGKVATYGQIAKLAKMPHGARQVARFLCAQTEKYNLPWHRIVNCKGKIVIADPLGFAMQKKLLEQEKIAVSEKGIVDLQKYQWQADDII